MPGYGYAAASKTKIKAWTALIHAFLLGRANLARVYLLLDARHGLKPVDDDVLRTLDKAAVNYQVVLTKADQVKDLAPLLAATHAATRQASGGPSRAAHDLGAHGRRHARAAGRHRAAHQGARRMSELSEARRHRGGGDRAQPRRRRARDRLGARPYHR